MLVPKNHAADLTRCRRGHFGRALEEAIHTHSSQWPSAWKEKNPLHGGGSFANMTPVERVRTNYILCVILSLIFALYRSPF